MGRPTLILALSVLAPLTAQDRIVPSDSGFDGFSTTVPMRDGKALAADVYRPLRAGRYPVVLIQTPYNKSLMRPWWAGVGQYGMDSLFTDTRYAFVVTDLRGRYASKSAKVDSPGQSSLGRDGFDTIAWITKQDWSNGKVATWGAAALANAQYETARESPPALVCAVPIVMPLQFDYNTYFHGGVLWQEFANMLGKLGWNIYGMLTAHPMKDESWETIRKELVQAKDIRIPMLFIGGWFDTYTDGVLAAFDQIRKQGRDAARTGSRLIMGPWVHRTDQVRNGELDYPNAELYGMKRTRAFFGRWLRGEQAKDSEPPITYYQMGAGEWRTTSVWPPAGMEERPYYLHDDRKLALKPPGALSAHVSFRYDPANPVPTVGGHVLDPLLPAGPQDQRKTVESRPDVLSFSTPALEEDLPLTGRVKVKVYVSSDRTDTDFTATLTDVYPDGRSMLVTEGIQRMRFRNGANKEDFLKPGEICPITIRLTHTAITFRKGHKVRVLISSSNYPKYAPNLNDGGPMYGKQAGVVAKNSVYFDATHPSALLLPVAAAETMRRDEPRRSSLQ
jgi:predicted acyl esterase